MTLKRSILLSLLAAIPVYFVTFVASWDAYRVVAEMYPRTLATKHQLIRIYSDVAAFRHFNGRVPRQLSEIEEPRFLVDRQGVPLDGWGNAIIYDADPVGTFTATSYGRDGRPGGLDLMEIVLIPGKRLGLTSRCGSLSRCLTLTRAVIWETSFLF